MGSAGGSAGSGGCDGRACDVEAVVAGAGIPNKSRIPVSSRVRTKEYPPNSSIQSINRT